MAIELHRWLAVASAVIVVAVGIDAAWSLRGRSRRLTPSRLQGLMLLGLGVTIAGGLGLLMGGARPQELLHFVYAAVAIGALPVGASLSSGWESRGRAAATLVAALVALVAVLRLFATG